MYIYDDESSDIRMTRENIKGFIMVNVPLDRNDGETKHIYIHMFFVTLF